MKFRTAKNTFQRDELVERLDLKPLNDMPELPLYGTEPRVQVQEPPRPLAGGRAAGPRLRRDRPARVLGVRRRGGRRVSQVHRAGASRSPTTSCPGRCWAASGTSPDAASRRARRSHWDAEVLEELVELLAETAPRGQFLWNNKQVVPFYVPGQTRTLGGRADQEDSTPSTCRSDRPQGPFPPGPLTGLGHDPQSSTASGPSATWCG